MKGEWMELNTYAKKAHYFNKHKLSNQYVISLCDVIAAKTFVHESNRSHCKKCQSIIDKVE